jgi:hypothetical protein
MGGKSRINTQEGKMGLTNPARTLKRKINRAVILVAVMLLIGVPVTVRAAIGAIDTNDSTVDGVWGTPMGPGILSPGNQYEIVNTDLPSNQYLRHF